MLIEEQSAKVCQPIGMQLPTARKGMVAEVLLFKQSILPYLLIELL